MDGSNVMLKITKSDRFWQGIKVKVTYLSPEHKQAWEKMYPRCHDGGCQRRGVKKLYYYGEFKGVRVCQKHWRRGVRIHP